MIRSTHESWTGLPLYHCLAGHEVRLTDVEFGDDMLVLWRSSGSVVEVRRAAGQRWSYTSRAGRCDFVVGGRFESIVCTPSAAPVLVVGLPRAQVRALLGPGSGGEPRGLPNEPHFQLQQRALYRMACRLEDQHRQGEPLGSAYSRALSAAIVERLAALAALPGPSKAHPAGNAAQVIDALIGSQLDNVPALADLAALTGMNTNQFLKWFKRHFDATPHQYVMRQRVEHAMRVLTESDAVSLTTLALQLGFNSHAHFTSVFRAQTGHTPSSYRRLRVEQGTDP